MDISVHILIQYTYIYKLIFKSLYKTTSAFAKIIKVRSRSGHSGQSLLLESKKASNLFPVSIEIKYYHWLSSGSKIPPGCGVLQSSFTMEVLPWNITIAALPLAIIWQQDPSRVWSVTIEVLPLKYYH